MKAIFLGLVALAVTGIAWAQQPSTAPADPAKDKTAQKAERNTKAQKDLKSATAGTEKGYAGAAAEGSAKAAAHKDTPKVTPDAAAKRKAVKEGTAGAGKGYGEAAAESAAVAAKDKSPRAPLPKPKAGTLEMNKVVP